MKQLNLFTGTLAALAFVSCSDKFDESYELPISGNEIEFGAYVNSLDASDKSRTIYVLPEGEEGKFDSYKSLGIIWDSGKDKVRVYSEQASPECKSADYTVKDDGTYQYLIKDSDKGVRWGDTSKDHIFYSFYPAGKIIEGLTSNTTVKVSIPVAQEKGMLLTHENTPAITEGWNIIAPDMSYCMMAGSGTWTAGTSKEVLLNYSPIVSVLDVVINGHESIDYNIISVSVRSKTEDIVGDFYYDLATKSFTPIEQAEDHRIATVSCIQGEGASSMPLKLKAGEKLNLKFFLLPKDIDAKQLSISVFMEGGYVLTQNLANGTTTGDYTLASGKISRVITPKIKAPETNNWMSMIGNNVRFTAISLPGTRFSYTGSMSFPSPYDPASNIIQKYQTKYVATGSDTQFDAGIRAFDVDLIVDGGSDNTPYVYAGTGRVNNPITGRDMTISDVLTALKGKVQPGDVTPTEGVVLFVNYVNNSLDHDLWTGYVNTAISNWDNANGNVLCKLEPTTTMNDMRGKIAVVLNLVTEEQAKPTYSQINYIAKYGTGRQNLSIEGKKYNGGSSTVYIQNLMQLNNPYIAEGDKGQFGWRSGAGLVPYYITQKVGDGEEASCDLIQKKIDLMNEMITRIKNDGGNSLFINDLSGFCVVKNSDSTGWMEYRTDKCNKHTFIGTWYDWDYVHSGTIYDYGTLDRSHYTYWWNQSRPDPSEDVEGDTSLTFTNNQSEKGNGGNTLAFAEKFNELATAAIQEMINTGRVPMGVVLMNFAGEAVINLGGKDYQVQGIRMPGLVMSNNFLFDLPEVTSNTK